MTYSFSDLDADEINDIHQAYIGGQEISISDLAVSMDSIPVVSYKHIEMDDKYGFRQPCFDNVDAITYFDRLKELTSRSINESREQSPSDWHFYETKGDNIRTELKRKWKNISNKNMPCIWHFALYTNQNSSRRSGIKSPRIHFLIGAHGMIHILFYDPYHEMNPM